MYNLALHKPVRVIEKTLISFKTAIKSFFEKIAQIRLRFCFTSKKKYVELEQYKNLLEHTLDERLKEILMLDKELFTKNEELYTVEQALNIQWESMEDLLSKLRIAQDKLVHTEKMASLGVLVAGIAHEINNPLNFINTGVLGLKENIDDILQLLNNYQEINADNVQSKLPKIKEFENKIDYQELITLIHRLISNIDIGISRMVNIVNGLRTFSRSDEKDLSAFNIHEYIESTLLILHNKYKNRIIIKKEYGDIPEIEGYTGKISQVFMNILSNSIDAIETKGEIIISTKYDSQSNNIIISIKDNGKGIPQKDIHKIFEPFFTTKSNGEGMGLGLSITYSIIKEHKGDIEVKSNNTEGTEFRITLPLKQ